MENKVLIQGIVKYNRNIESKNGNIHVYSIEQTETTPSGKEYRHSFMVKLFGQKSKQVFKKETCITVRGTLASESYQNEKGEWIRNVIVRASEIKETELSF